MASLLSPTATTFRQDSIPIFFSPSRDSNPISQGVFSSSWRKNSIKCNAFLDDISANLMKRSIDLDQSLSQFPFFQELQRVTGELPEVQKLGVLVFVGFTWIYLTARPGVLIGAIDAYILAPLQVGFDSLIGRRSLKMADFLIGDRLGEGSFGVVYSGVIVPKNVNLNETVKKRGSRKALRIDERFKEKVILKKIIGDGARDFFTVREISFHFLLNIIYPIILVMASLKSSRSRGASNRGGAVKLSSKDAGTKFEENINVFNEKVPQFFLMNLIRN